MKNLDFVAIGEIAIDAFIRLKEASVNCEVDNKNCKLCMDFGAKIPYESVEEIPAVANAGNASVCASRIGIQSAIVAHIGKDTNGEKCLASFKNDGVITEYISIDNDKDTNYHYVLWFEEDRTILQKHSDFNYSLPDIGEPKWIYLTSLGEKSLNFHQDISKYLDSHSDTRLAFQPGIFQIKFGVEELKNIYAKTDVFFCNVEEAQIILKNQTHILPTLLKEMAKLGPKIVIITDGINGAYSYDTKNDTMLFMPVYPHTPFERTGAGDAFASTIISCLAKGKSLEEALMWAPINSMSVTQFVGAQKGLLTSEKIDEYLAKAPEDYRPQIIK